MTNPIFILTLSCPDRIGIVADVSRFLAEHVCNIQESAQYNDPESGHFFLRTCFESMGGQTVDSLREDFQDIAGRFGMSANFYDSQKGPATLIMVSKAGHCLNDLLFRWSIGALPVDVKMVVSNHRDFESLVLRHGLPFRYLPVTPQTKLRQEEELERIIAAEDIELIVLARYMQVLSAAFCGRHPAQVINIHHSFLPSFKGAKPYHQAHARGVKLIGATAHYVTADLDEGPIIEQAVERVTHNSSAGDFAAMGRDVEALVLARAVKWHAERRVLLNGNRTVVFG